MTQVALVFILLYVLGLVAFRFEPFWHKTRRSATMERLEKIVGIRNALSEYRYEHGSLPDRLSWLCPSFIPADQMAVWFCKRDTSATPLPESLRDISRIDENCDYLYFPRVPIISDDLAHQRSELEIVLCERPYSADTKTKFVAVFNDLSGGTMTRQKLEEALSRTRQELTAAPPKPALLTPTGIPDSKRTIIKLESKDIP